MYNYTQLGYAKIKAPEHIFQLVQRFWETNKDRQVPEDWPMGYVSEFVVVCGLLFLLLFLLLVVFRVLCVRECNKNGLLGFRFWCASLTTTTIQKHSHIQLYICIYDSFFFWFVFVFLHIIIIIVY